MGRKVVLEVICDRCTKVEHRAEPQGQAQMQEPIMTATFRGKTVKFTDLCSNCIEVLDTHWKEISKTMQKVSPQRDRSHKEKKEAAAPTKSVAPVPQGLGSKQEPHGASQRS